MLRNSIDEYWRRLSRRIFENIYNIILSFRQTGSREASSLEVCNYIWINAKKYEEKDLSYIKNTLVDISTESAMMYNCTVICTDGYKSLKGFGEWKDIQDNISESVWDQHYANST